MARYALGITTDVFVERLRSETSGRKLADLLVAGLYDRDHDLYFQALTMSWIWSTIPPRPHEDRKPQALYRPMSPAHRRELIAAMRRCRNRKSLFVLKIRAMLGDRVSVAGVMKRIQRGKEHEPSFALGVLREIHSPAATAALHRLAARSRSKEFRLEAIEALVGRGDFSRVSKLEAELAALAPSERFGKSSIAAALLFAGSQAGVELVQSILAEGTEANYRSLEFTWRVHFRRGAYVTDWKADLRSFLERAKP